MVVERSILKLEIATKVITFWENFQEKGATTGLTVQCIKVSSIMAVVMVEDIGDRVPTRPAIPTMAYTKMIKSVDGDCIPGRMEWVTRANLWMTYDRVREQLDIPTEKLLKRCGKMVHGNRSYTARKKSSIR
jgi:hypothetical protein